MNKLIFFLPVLILLPLISDADAIRGYDSETVRNADGSITKTLGLPPYIHDGNQYVPFIHTDFADFIQIETEHGSVQLDKTTCEFSFFKKGIINATTDTPLFSDSIIALQSQDNVQFNPVNQVNNAVCSASWNGSELTATKSHSVGVMEYKFILNNGKWKTQLEVTNTSGLNDRYFGFAQILNLNRDTINYGGSQKNLDNFDGQTFDRTWLENNEGKVIDLLNGFYFDFDLAFNNLGSVKVVDTGTNKSRLIFAYDYNSQLLLDGQTLVYDPTFGELTGSIYRVVDSTQDLDTTCNNVSMGIDNTETFASGLRASTSTSNPTCTVTAYEFDISNIPDTAEITDVDFIYDVDLVTGGINCDFNQLSNQPSIYDSGSDAQGLWNDVLNGTEYVNNDATCTTVANNKNQDLGATADTDLENNLDTENYFAVGVSFDQHPTRDAGGLHRIDISDPRLSVTYDMPPDVVNVFNATLNQPSGHTAASVLLEWAAGDANGGIGMIHSVDRWSGSEWVRLTGPAAINSYTDESPLDQGTSMYRVVSNDSEGVNLGTFPIEENLADNLLSKFVLDWTVTDAGLLGNDGTITGNELYVNDTTDSDFPRVGFDGNSITYINATNESDYDFDNSDAFSIVFWSYILSSSAFGDTHAIFAKGSNIATEAGYYSRYFDSDVGSCPCMDFIITDTGLTQNLVRVSASGGALDDTWQHWVFTYDGSSNRNGMNIYLDGSLTATGTAQAIASTLNNQNLTISNWSGGGVPLGGYVDEFLIFDTELTADQVADLYNAASTPFPRIDTAFPPDPPVLSTSGETFESVDLDATVRLFGGSLIGYQVNYTTPFGDPTTIVSNNTALPATVGDLNFATDYSFHVRPLSTRGNVTHSNIANTTTLGQSFTIGALEVNQTNPNLVDIQFERSDINDTTTRLDVVYPNTYNLTCTLSYEFGRTSQNYSNLDTVAFSATQDNSSFFFINHTNDIVDVYCFNEDDATNDGSYELTWSNFPLLDQIQSFRSGDYGTTGELGALDFVTLAAIIIGMVGLNRVNESVGAVFGIAILGALAYFEIIELPTVIFGALAVVVLFIFTTTRKD